MAYQCKSCVYCQASVSLLSRKIKEKKIEEIKGFIEIGEQLFDDVKITLEKHWKDFMEIFDKKKPLQERMFVITFKNNCK